MGNRCRTSSSGSKLSLLADRRLRIAVTISTAFRLECAPLLPWLYGSLPAALGG